MVRKILMLVKSPPYGAGRAAEGFRMATALIAMDVMPQILFLDDGVYCLVKEQTPEAARLNSFGERLKTLSDLVGLYAMSDSMAHRNLDQNDFAETLKVETLTVAETAKLISQNETVITF